MSEKIDVELEKAIFARVYAGVYTAKLSEPQHTSEVATAWALETATDCVTEFRQSRYRGGAPEELFAEWEKAKAGSSRPVKMR